MQYRPDFEAVQERMTAWWACEVTDRVCLQVTAPKCTPREIAAPAEIIDRWLNMEYVLEVAEERMRCTYYAGEAIPTLMPNLGPDAFAGYLGSELVFSETTTWAKPVIADWENPPSLELDFAAAWWQEMESMCRKALEYARGKFFVTLPDGHGGADGLAALRRPQQLCMDMIDYPEEVLRAVATLDAQNLRYYERLYPIFHAYQNGACGFVPAWGPGKTATTQCDFLALIGPHMSEKLVMPGLRMETEYLDNAVFHLDGPDALVHLDLLLEIPGINAIQWVPGAGNPTAVHWLEHLKKVQAKGKGLFLYADGPAEVETLIRELRPEGLLISTGAATPEDADELVCKAGQWTSGRGK